MSVILKDLSFQRTSSDSWNQKSWDELEWCGLNCNVSSRLKYFRGEPGVSWFSFNFTLNNSALDHSAIAPSFSGDFFVVRRSPLSAFAIPCFCTRWVQSLYYTVHELSKHFEKKNLRGKYLGRAGIQTWGCWVKSANATSVLCRPPFPETWVPLATLPGRHLSSVSPLKNRIISVDVTLLGNEKSPESSWSPTDLFHLEMKVPVNREEKWNGFCAFLQHPWCRVLCCHCRVQIIGEKMRT